MSWFRRLGLQRRIMLYVGTGLALMFGIVAYGGFLAIRQATELVYQERLGTAFTTAATLEHNIQELVYDVEFIRGRLLRVSSPQDLEETGADLLAEVSRPNAYPLVRAQGVWFVDGEGRVQLALPSSAEPESRSLPVSTLTAAEKPALLAPVAPSGEPHFGILVVPIRDVAGIPRWTVVLQLAALNRSEPYYSPPRRDIQKTAAPAERSDSYGLEVTDLNGRVALSIGGKTPPGRVSPHVHLLQEGASRSPSPGPLVFLHGPRKGEKFAPHVVAAVPLASGPFVLFLQQNQDVTLALPLRLRQRLFLFSGLGFLATMLVAWVTTRHVVKPTEQLTAAAQRIAEGRVETPITVAAQDEIGTLAESLETMRQRLQAWGSELEKQVRERTFELQETNRELRALYETLRAREEQLRVVLGKVLGAQEDERRRVSRELHDGIGQALSALLMEMERLEQLRPDDWANLQLRAQRLRYIATESLRDLRRLTIALRPAALDDLGLVPAIRRYGELYLGNVGVAFRVEEAGLDARLDSSLETVIYRVVQEAINNVARHSGASAATVRLESTPGLIAVTVEDNGRGFDPTLATTTPGVGIQGMQERASLAGGKLTVESQPGHGTTVRLEIPLIERVATTRDA
ncbi:MAG: sensor histidine kinase [Chloroflexi bacterium]|nr:sensor histidine kinase [Chloroflexota bacterium]